jgi:hypothetical protein
LIAVAAVTIRLGGLLVGYSSSTALLVELLLVVVNYSCPLSLDVYYY